MWPVMTTGRPSLVVFVTVFIGPLYIHLYVQSRRQLTVSSRETEHERLPYRVHHPARRRRRQRLDRYRLRLIGRLVDHRGRAFRGALGSSEPVVGDGAWHA